MMDRDMPPPGRRQKRKSLQDDANDMEEWPPKRPARMLFPEAHGIVVAEREGSVRKSVSESIE